MKPSAWIRVAAFALAVAGLAAFYFSRHWLGGGLLIAFLCAESVADTLRWRGS